MAQDILVGKHPERFLATDFVDSVSVLELVSWLDFVYGETKGLNWLDEMRRNLNENWYTGGWFSDSGSGLNKNIGVGIDKERQMVIPSLQKLVARSAVFEGFVAQYELLEAQQMKPSAFEHQIASLPESAAIDGYFILEPVRNARLKAV